MENIFITGINGLLGTNLTIDLLEQGYYVKGLIRDKSKYQGISSANLELIEGNLFDNIGKFLKNVDTVIHVAAETSQQLTDLERYINVNFHATACLLHSAISCGVRKFIFISTANTLGYGESVRETGNEQKKIKFPFTHSFYAKSKLEAENYILKYIHKIEINIINPTFMLGAYDSKPSSGKIIQMGLKNKIIFYPPGGKNFVWVKDVSQGIINTIHKGENGQKYLLANENLTYKEFFTRLNYIANQRPLMIKIPKWMLISIGYLGNVARKLNVKTNISSVNMRILCIHNFYTNNKSRQQLNLTYHDVNHAIKEAIIYFTIDKRKKHKCIE